VDLTAHRRSLDRKQTILSVGFAPLYNLVDVILARGDNGSPAEAGCRTVEMLDAAYRSAERGGEAVTIAELYV